jgi:osmotically-inducible protein OsmY
MKRIRRDSRINDAMIEVDVNNGIAKVTGLVSSYKKKLAVDLKVKHTRGVVSVDNLLEVFYPEEYGNPSREQIKKTVETILTVNPEIDDKRIDIDVASGIVTLKGSVKWFWQLHKTEDLISNIVGVKGLKNELTVVPTEKIGDEVIAEAIMDELGASDLVDQSNILVEVHNGAVTLSGSVKTFAAENEAYEAAIQQPGVTLVLNNIALAADQ